MKKLVYLFTFLFLCSFAIGQTTLDHATGNFNVTVADDGVIGDDGTGDYGAITYQSFANVIYTGGVVYGLDGAVVGMCASYDLYDFENYAPWAGFMSNSVFDQMLNWEVQVAADPTWKVVINTFSRNNDPIVYLRLKIPNYQGSTISGIYPGLILDWDVAAYSANGGGYDTGRNLMYIYDTTPSTSDPSYYGIMVLNVAPGSMTGNMLQNYSATNQDVYNYLTNTDFSTAPPVEDHRMHTGVGPFDIPAGQVLTVDFAILAGDDLAGIQANADLAMTYSTSLPVEMTSFTAVQNGSQVVLEWNTATELNNLGFEVERKIGDGSWNMVGFKEGHGSTSEPQSYVYTDNISGLNSGTISYRLKQIDFGGNFTYSDVVDLGTFATSYELSQNYPNPFNPATQISYSILEDGMVNLEVFNMLGEKVATLVNSYQESGKYFVDFDASNLSSGTYIYKLTSGDFTAVQKMMLLK